MNYALITPARNEVALIEQTIRAVATQTVRPIRWIIVSDGSTDGTDDVVNKHASEHPWIQLLRLPERADRQFAAKARAFNAGYACLLEWEHSVFSVPRSGFSVVGNLDADITFGSDYYAFLLAKLAENPFLGVTGTPFVENIDSPKDHSYDHANANLNHVSGAVQLFRRDCFEQVGGYVPIKGGAIDWIAVTTARMKGWETRTFTERICFHHRKLGTGTGVDAPFRMRFHYGRKAYYVGGHPIWEVSRALFAMKRKPYVLGGLWFIAGFVWAALNRVERPVSSELIAFHRAEQMARFRRVFRRSSAIQPQKHLSNSVSADVQRSN